MQMKYSLLRSLVAALIITSAHADELTPAKKADIVKLLSINGTERLIEPFASIITQSYMQSLGNCPGCSPKIPDVVRTEVLGVLRAHVNGEGGLIERQVALYQQRFTHAEIKQLLTFYNSPIGQKMVSESSELMRDSINVSQQWGHDLAPEMRKQIDAGLTKAGIKPPAPASPPPSIMQPPPAAK
jgi:hypothetical protein